MAGERRSTDRWRAVSVCQHHDDEGPRGVHWQELRNLSGLRGRGPARGPRRRRGSRGGARRIADLRGRRCPGGQLGGERRLGDRRLGDDERVGRRGARLAPVSVDRIVGAAARPSPATTVLGRIDAAGSRESARSGTSAALWNRPPPTTGGRGDDRDLVAGLGQVEGRPEAAPVAEIVEHDARGRRMVACRRGRRGSPRRRDVPRRAGDRPSAAPAGTRSVAAARRSRPPPRRRPRPRHRRRSPSARAGPRRPAPRAGGRTTRAGPGSGPRDGCRPASRNWPPSSPPRSSSVTRWPRSAATRAASRPAGPPPTTSTDLRGRRRLEPVAAPLELAPGRRVHEARDPVVARAAAPAQLVARDARPHLVGAVGAGLGDEVRIGDLAADDADHVGLAGGEHGLGGLGRPDVALGLDHGVRDDPLERGGERHAELLLVQRDRDDRVEVEVRARAAGDVVHQLAAASCHATISASSAIDSAGAERSSIDDRQPDDEVVAAGRRGSARGSSREKRIRRSNVPPHASVAAVRPRRPELVDERVVGGEDLDPVEAGVLRAARARDEPVDDLLDLGLGHRVAAVGVVVRRQARRRPVRRERVVGVAVLARRGTAAGSSRRPGSRRGRRRSVAGRPG